MGDEHRVSVSYEGLIRDLSVGDKILLNNGLLVFEVEKLTATDAICKVLVGGETSNNKSMSFPNKVLNQVFLSQQDKEDILFGIRNGVDYIACSFVSRKQDLDDVQAFLNENGGEGIGLIAKIENQTGIDNIESICESCEGIMIGRGDLGVEVPFEKLPSIQKRLITKCRMLGKRVITATEMLESMIYNARPTRAEISDVANAVYDGSSAIMLSGETAVGKYPALTVATMSRIAEETESAIHYDRRFYQNAFRIKNTVDAISHATCGMAIDINAKAIVACTLSGMTARMVSRFRPPVDILGLTTNEHTLAPPGFELGGYAGDVRRVQLHRRAVLYGPERGQGHLRSPEGGTRSWVTGGVTNGKSGNTNLIKVETI